MTRAALRFLFSLMAVMALAIPAQAADDFLPPEQAFRFSATQLDGQTIDIKFAIADGYYLYRERLSVAADPATVALAPLALPAGEIKFDETFNRQVEVYRRALTLRVKVRPAQTPFVLIVTSQGCADQGLCYAPIKHRFDARPVSSLAARVPAGAADAMSESGPDRIARTLYGGNLGAIAGLFFGLGLLLSFTPCVLPMLPILSAIVVGAHATRKRAVRVSLAYVLGMAVAYTAIGVAAGLAGQGLQAALQNAWVLSAFAGLVALFALSMFGVYALQFPQAWRDRLMAVISGRQGSGQLAGAAAMGGLSALMVSPCVTPALAGALAYIMQTGNALAGGVALFAMSIGMGAPLLLIGAGVGNVLPRAGRWMVIIQTMFGWMLLMMALWIVQPVLPIWLVMAAWAALLIAAAVFLRAFDTLPADAGNAQRLGKAIGVMLALAGIVQGAGLAAGGRDPLQPLAGLMRASSSGMHDLTFKRVKRLTELEAEIRGASAAGRPVMLDIYADWCISCKEMERFTFTDARVRAALDGVLLLRADVTANDADDQALLKRFGLFGPPGVIFFDAQGRAAPVRVVGFEPADAFLASLRRALGAAQAGSSI